MKMKIEMASADAGTNESADSTAVVSLPWWSSELEFADHEF